MSTVNEAAIANTNILLSSLESWDNNKTSQAKKLGYIYEPGKLTLSYSKLQTFHRCPREFYIKEILGRGTYSASIDTAYGSAFGAAVQSLFSTGGDLPKAIVDALAAWDYDSLRSEFKNKESKSFHYLVESIRLWAEHEFPMLWEEYKLAEIPNVPAIEPLVYISINEHFSFQQHIDLLLQHRETNEVRVAEIKTSGAQQQEAMWGNADQTLGYLATVRHVCEKENIPFNDEILYIVQETGHIFSMEKNYGFHQFPYMKNEEASSEFVLTLLLYANQILDYIKYAMFPKRGASCIRFGRSCSYYGMCGFEQIPERMDINDILNLAQENSAYEPLPPSAANIKITCEEILHRMDENI